MKKLIPFFVALALAACSGEVPTASETQAPVAPVPDQNGIVTASEINPQGGCSGSEYDNPACHCAFISVEWPYCYGSPQVCDQHLARANGRHKYRNAYVHTDVWTLSNTQHISAGPSPFAYNFYVSYNPPFGNIGYMGVYWNGNDGVHQYNELACYAYVWLAP